MLSAPSSQFYDVVAAALERVLIQHRVVTHKRWVVASAVAAQIYGDSAYSLRDVRDVGRALQHLGWVRCYRNGSVQYEIEDLTP